MIGSFVDFVIKGTREASADKGMSYAIFHFHCRFALHYLFGL